MSSKNNTNKEKNKNLKQSMIQFNKNNYHPDQGMSQQDHEIYSGEVFSEDMPKKEYEDKIENSKEIINTGDITIQKLCSRIKKLVEDKKIALKEVEEKFELIEKNTELNFKLKELEKRNALLEEEIKKLKKEKEKEKEDDNEEIKKLKEIIEKLNGKINIQDFIIANFNRLHLMDNMKYLEDKGMHESANIFRNIIKDNNNLSPNYKNINIDENISNSITKNTTFNNINFN